MRAKYNNRKRKKRFFFVTGFGQHLFFQKKRGTLLAVGKNEFGQLGLGSLKEKSCATPEIVTFFREKSGKQVKDCACGNEHSVFLTKKGSVFTCGKDNRWQLVLGGTSLISKQSNATPKKVRNDKSTSHQRIVKVFAGPNTTYQLTRAGNVIVGGDNISGCLCMGEAIEKVRKGKMIKNLTGVVDITPGGTGRNDEFVIFLGRDGRVWSAGGHYHNCFGIPLLKENEKVHVPTQVKFPKNDVKIASIVSASDASYFLTTDLQVYVCGNGIDGQFGDGERKKVKKLSICPVMCGFDMFCSGKNDGFILYSKEGTVWGSGYNGDKGTGVSYVGAWGQDEYLSPVQVQGIKKEDKVEQIETSMYNSYLICNEGKTVYATGKNDFGTIMNGNRVHTKRFERVGNNFNLGFIGESVSVEKKERVEFLLMEYSIRVVLLAFLVPDIFALIK